MPKQYLPLRRRHLSCEFKGTSPDDLLGRIQLLTCRILLEEIVTSFSINFDYYDDENKRIVDLGEAIDKAHKDKHKTGVQDEHYQHMSNLRRAGNAGCHSAMFQEWKSGKTHYNKGVHNAIEYFGYCSEKILGLDFLNNVESDPDW